MTQQPKIITIESKDLIGMSTRPAPDDLMTVRLWKTFMPRRKEILNAIDSVVYSVQIFDELPSPRNKDTIQFTKWAAVEVHDIQSIPEGMHHVNIPAGQYAVFLHEGVSEKFYLTMQFIFETWLPNSGNSLSDRPHFARMDERYLGPGHPGSIEEIYVPIE